MCSRFGSTLSNFVLRSCSCSIVAIVVQMVSIDCIHPLTTAQLVLCHTSIDADGKLEAQ